MTKADLEKLGKALRVKFGDEHYGGEQYCSSDYIDGFYAALELLWPVVSGLEESLLWLDHRKEEMNKMLKLEKHDEIGATKILRNALAELEGKLK